MAGHIQNGSLPTLPISDAQASILDMMLFPGFTRMSSAIQGYLTIDLSVYAPLLCFFGLLVFACRRICKSLWEWLQTYCTSTIHLHYREDPYDMLILWISFQSFAQNTLSSLVTTNLDPSLSHSRNSHSNGGDANKKTLYYTPWNGRFLFRYKGRLVVFRRQYQAGDFRSREDVSISCFGRSSQILKELLSECRTEYAKLVQGKTCLYEHKDGAWIRSAVSDIRPISTVVLDESKKKELLGDIGDFLNPTTQKWYSDRSMPYRRGYLLYGPPGTGKSSLSCAIAGVFGLNIYILSLPEVTEAGFKSLFANLPKRCVILLEDVDAASSNRDTEIDSRQIATGSPSQGRKSGNVSLSTLLNAIDGVASKEGRVLIMTTNHINHLDEALIRPGRVDKKVELGLADSNMAADLFCLVFKPVEGAVAPPENTQSDALVGSGENRKVHESVRSQKKEAERVERLAENFAAQVPELNFSTAEILSFLLKHKKSPEGAIDNLAQLISKPIEARTKLPRISEDAQPETAREFKLVRF
ncbi:BCS1 N terminal-domain-containing protein [Leptodontidium sp. MPI-SDFR-AT-0119]|nr:BCS1 N terminal-domain-containing protein [Leptodontidium sp. MPI-SDFR-AT-0119]